MANNTVLRRIVLHLLGKLLVLTRLIMIYCGSFHCSYLWAQFNKLTLSKIRVASSNLYRKSLHVSRRSSASEMFVKKNIPNFESLLRKETFLLTLKLKCSSNAIINTIESCIIESIIDIIIHNLESLAH